MNEWGLPISKDKIIARRNRLIEYQKLGELRFTPLYEAIDENILDINYMIHEIDNLQSKIDKAIEYIEKHLEEHIIEDQPDEQSIFYDEKGYYIPNAKEQLLDILKGSK